MSRPFFFAHDTAHGAVRASLVDEHVQEALAFHAKTLK